MFIPRVGFRMSSRDNRNGFVGALELFRGRVPMKDVHAIGIDCSLAQRKGLDACLTPLVALSVVSSVTTSNAAAQTLK